MESLAFKLIFGFILSCFSPTQLGAEEIFLPDDQPTMQDVVRPTAVSIIIDIAPTQISKATEPTRPTKPTDESKEDKPLFAAIPNGTRDEIAQWCETRAGKEGEPSAIATNYKQGLRDRSPLGKTLKQGGHRRLNMNLG